MMLVKIEEYVQLQIPVVVQLVGMVHCVLMVCICKSCKLGTFNHMYVALLTAICTHTCENGGTCSAPNTCSCTASWTGSLCTNGVYMSIV